MNKLVERFRSIKENDYYDEEFEDLAFEAYATEAKKLAVEYKWWSVTQPIKIFDIKELPEGMDIEPFLKLKEQEQFDKFLDEYYK